MTGNFMANEVLPILANMTATGYGNAINIKGLYRSYQGVVTGTGSVSATIVVEVSNDQTNWLTLGTITLSGTTTATDGFSSAVPWAYTRGHLSALSGTGATAKLLAGI